MSQYTMVFLIVLIALLYAGFEHWLREKRKMRQLDAEAGADETTLERLRKLEERVEVLERIATDSTADLKRQISNL